MILRARVYSWHEVIHCESRRSCLGKARITKSASALETVEGFTDLRLQDNQIVDFCTKNLFQCIASSKDVVTFSGDGHGPKFGKKINVAISRPEAFSWGRAKSVKALIP